MTKVFTDLKVDYEIIWVNDCSPDNASKVLKELSIKDPHVIVIEHTRNFGSQSAFLSGMEISTGDSVVLMDSDGQDEPELIPQFYAKWREGYEVVYGQRVDRDASAFMKPFYKLFYRIFRATSYIPMPLDAGDFSLIDRKVVNELLKLPETDQFLRGLRAWVGFKQIGVPYHRPERLFGKSTNNLRRNIEWAKKGIFSFSYVPLELLTYMGVFLTFIAFCGIIWQITYKIMNPTAAPGFASVIVLILFFGGLNLFAISIIGEYIAKIFEETKKRPKYIRRFIMKDGVEAATWGLATKKFNL